MTNLYLSPLRKVPGPKLWALSRIPSQRSVLRGHTHLDILELHEKYGPVVRISPYEVAFNSASAFKTIYGFKGSGGVSKDEVNAERKEGKEMYRKDRSHYILPINNVDHLVSAVDPAVHARQRRLLSFAFSEKALKEQEGLIKGYVETLVQKLSEICQKDSAGDGKPEETVESNGRAANRTSKGVKADIKSWMNYTTFDITGDLMFGEPFGCLTSSTLHPWIGFIFNSIKAISLVGAINQFPPLDKVLQMLLPKKVMQEAKDHFDLGSEKVNRRLEGGTERPDFVSAILKNGMVEGKGEVKDKDKMMSRAEIHSNAFMCV
jgi:hypothetical protein